MMPEKFNNKTNGITQRRFLLHGNPLLASWVTDKIGDDWITNLDHLKHLKVYVDDEKCQQEVHQHSAYHDQQTLPRRFGAEFPRLRGLLHLFGIHRLIYHSRNLTVTAQRQPPHTVFRIAVLRLVLEQREPRVKKDIELLYTYLEKARKEKVSSFMNDDQQRKAENQLKGTNQKCFHLQSTSVLIINFHSVNKFC